MSNTDAADVEAGTSNGVGDPQITDRAFAAMLDTRARSPRTIADRLASRARRPLLGSDGLMFIVAADHPARGALAIGNRPLAMADRRDLLERLAVSLADPRVDGVMASADIIEDLLLLDLLEERIVIGTMNRGGLAGSTWELDDRFTCYDPEHLVRAGLDGGKMLLRIDDTDPATVPTLESCSRMVSALADAEMMAMVEPLPYLKRAKGHAVLDPSVPHLIRAVAVASGLGWTSAWTWLKVPSGPQVSQVLAASTLPALILGGAPGPDPGAELVSWSQAMMEPTCRGLVVGRSLLYPQGGDVAARIAEAADLFPSRRGAPR